MQTTSYATALPTLVIGNASEQLVARTLAAQGFRLVCQSRASRGTFDLLAILNSTQLGIQVKRTTLPFCLPAEAYEAMDYWAERLGWLPLLVLHVDDEVKFYTLPALEPGKTRKGYCVDAETPVTGHVLRLLRRNNV